jgi:hypothetical protein
MLASLALLGIVAFELVVFLFTHIWPAFSTGATDAATISDQPRSQGQENSFSFSITSVAKNTNGNSFVCQLFDQFRFLWSIGCHFAFCDEWLAGPMCATDGAAVVNSAAPIWFKQGHGPLLTFWTKGGIHFSPRL